MMRQEPRSIAELFAVATDWTDDESFDVWKAVDDLQEIGSREVFERAMEFTGADDPRLRARGLDILGRLGAQTLPFLEESLAVTIRLATHDAHQRVLEAAAGALGHLRDPRGINALVHLAGNSDASVRWQVAFALGGRTEPAAVAALIELTNDPDSDVRDWATFGLGQNGTVDTPAVREALHLRLADTDEDTRYEAMCGLARCGDLRVVRPLTEALTTEPDNHAHILPATMLLNIPEGVEGLVADDLIARLRSLLAT
jgi:HEAT repeat protein